MVESYAPLLFILVGFIDGFLCTNHRSKGFAISWGHVLERMVMQGMRYAWGSCMFAHLYDELYQVVYGQAQSLGVGCSPLQIWAWEHFAVTQPLTWGQQPVRCPYRFRYVDIIAHLRLGKLDHW